MIPVSFFGIQERADSELRAHSSSVRGNRSEAEIPEDIASKTGKIQPFIKEEVLVSIYNVCVLPFCLLLTVNFVTLILVFYKLVCLPGYIFVHSREVL